MSGNSILEGRRTVGDPACLVSGSSAGSHAGAISVSGDVLVQIGDTSVEECARRRRYKHIEWRSRPINRWRLAVAGERSGRHRRLEGAGPRRSTVVSLRPVRISISVSFVRGLSQVRPAYRQAAHLGHRIDCRRFVVRSRLLCAVVCFCALLLSGSDDL